MTYLRVTWLHDYPDDPRTIVVELDEERWETRKVELFPDGTKGWADATTEVGTTGLALVQTPSIEEIASDPQFVPEEITAHEFERLWRERTESATRTS